MKKVVLSIDGMKCGMCEAHVNDLFRKNIKGIKKIKSNHKKNITTIILDEFDENNIKNVLKDSGYVINNINVFDVSKFIFWYK